MLKRKVFLSLAVLFALSMLVVVSALAKEGPGIQNSDNQVFDVKLNKAISVENIEEILLNNTEIEVEGFYNFDTVEDRTYTGGYVLNPNMDLKEAIKDYKKQYYHSLMQGIETLENRIKSIKDPILKKSAMQILEDTKSRKKKFLEGQTIKIDALRISGNENQLNSFKVKNSTKISEFNEVKKNK